MTKRQKAAQHYHGWHERQAEPRYLPDGDRIFEVLRGRGKLIPSLATHPAFRCIACDVLIEPGYTAFTPAITQLPYPTICRSCGVGWEMFNNRMTPLQATWIPVFGGPVP